MRPANLAFTMSNIRECSRSRIRSSCFRRGRFRFRFNSDGLPTEAARLGTSPPSLLRASEDNLRCCAAQVGGARRDRTDDLKLAKLALSQLSYGPIRQTEVGVPPEAAKQRRMVGPGRVERPTSRLSGVRSNHLSYWPDRDPRRASSVLQNWVICQMTWD